MKQDLVLYYPEASVYEGEGESVYVRAGGL